MGEMRRGRLRGTLDLQGVSAIFDDGLDVNGRSQTLVAFGGLQGDGYMEGYRAHQISCTDSLPRHSGMMCATQRVGAEYKVMRDDLRETGNSYIRDCCDADGWYDRLIYQWFTYECSVTVSSYEGASWRLVGLPEDDIPAWVNLDEHRFVGFWGDDIVGYTDNGQVAIIDEVDESECPSY